MSEKSPVIIDLKFDQEQVAAALKGAFPDREVINLSHPASRNRDLSGIDYAVVWKPGADPGHGDVVVFRDPADWLADCIGAAIGVWLARR